MYSTKRKIKKGGGMFDWFTSAAKQNTTQKASDTKPPQQQQQPQPQPQPQPQQPQQLFNYDKNYWTNYGPGQSYDPDEFQKHEKIKLQEDDYYRRKSRIAENKDKKDLNWANRAQNYFDKSAVAKIENPTNYTDAIRNNINKHVNPIWNNYFAPKKNTQPDGQQQQQQQQTLTTGGKRTHRKHSRSYRTKKHRNRRRR